MGSQAQPVGHVSYSALKAWIYDQEDYERRTGEPAPLAGEQRLAMAVLVSPQRLSPPALSLKQEGVDGMETDWSYKDAIVPAEYVYEELPASIHGSPQWRTRCRLPREAPDLWFPDVNEPRPEDSVFQSKKASRQHAARCAIEWLISQGLMSSDGFHIKHALKNTAAALASSASSTAVTTVRDNTPSARNPSQSRPRPLLAWPAEAAARPATDRQASPSPGADPRDSVPAEGLDLRQQPNPATSSPTPQPMASWAGGGASVNAGSWNLVMAAADRGITATNVVGGRGNISSFSERPSHAWSDGNDYEVSSIQQLDSLCKALKLGSPTYNLVPSGEGAEGIFSGRIVFSPLSTKGGGTSVARTLPEGVGEVHNVFTKKAAREKMAQSVLRYLNTACGDVLDTRMEEVAVDV
ncbi:hypothetical protein SPBR_02852 [Sporothrix brasiliensis 5110]|uniref:DRBM domain-containing protein n=1 Tax=Sporothrix brasiliensis 5110 TaxID=1398154 RepID=A0A0C2IT23_9PEZI|nr:uncharacterized protein SPBR_02852 [Sporothrix brasiliensis 5110]KIH92191.1 hypothetical protein SPBR_02852 [Sporothrix brasiliensis 5110]